MSNDAHRKKELSKELDTYIASRRTAEDDAETTTVVRQHEEEPVQVEAASEPVVTINKKNWFSSWMGKVFTPEQAPQSDTVDMSRMGMSDVEIKEDMKVLAGIALAVVKQLPDRTLKEFKESSDFGKFKDILRKHSIIK